MSENQSYGTPPPDPNQDKNEPIGTSPEASVQAGDSSASSGAGPGDSSASSGAGPGDSSASSGAGTPPRPMDNDDAAGAQQMARSARPPVDGGVPTPGDAQGVAVPSVQAAAGTSEEHGKVDGVAITSLAAPGKPDGEVDTRPSAVSPSAGQRPSSTSR